MIVIFRPKIFNIQKKRFPIFRENIFNLHREDFQAFERRFPKFWKEVSWSSDIRGLSILWKDFRSSERQFPISRKQISNLMERRFSISERRLQIFLTKKIQPNREDVQASQRRFRIFWIKISNLLKDFEFSERRFPIFRKMTPNIQI